MVCLIKSYVPILFLKALTPSDCKVTSITTCHDRGPHYRLTQEMCKVDDPQKCPVKFELYAYMGPGWRDGSTCGADYYYGKPTVCLSGVHACVTNKYALCAKRGF